MSATFFDPTDAFEFARDDYFECMKDWLLDLIDAKDDRLVQFGGLIVPDTSNAATQAHYDNWCVEQAEKHTEEAVWAAGCG